jgi:hypothetical protein
MDEERDTRWQEIMDAQADFADQPAQLREAGLDRPPRRRRGDRKSEQFNEALSDLGSWSSLDEPRRRLSA